MKSCFSDFHQDMLSYSCMCSGRNAWNTDQSTTYWVNVFTISANCSRTSQLSQRLFLPRICGASKEWLYRVVTESFGLTSQPRTETFCMKEQLLWGIEGTHRASALRPSSFDRNHVPRKFTAQEWSLQRIESTQWARALTELWMPIYV